VNEKRRQITEHDTRYRRLYGHKAMVRDLLVGFVTGIPADLDVQGLELRNASQPPEHGFLQPGDLVWKIPVASDRLLYLRLELQSSGDPSMAMRMHGYVAALLDELWNDVGHLPGGKLPTVLPVVLYSGRKKWYGPTDLKDLMVRPPLDLEAVQPAQRFWLIQGRDHAPDELDRMRNLVAATFRIERPRSWDDVKPVIDRLITWLPGGEHAALRRELSMFISWRLRLEFRDSTIPDMPELLEVRRMLEEKDDLPLWEQWRQEGKEQGIKEGVKEGERKALRLVLQERFGALPEWAEERLASTEEEQLIRWLGLAVSAPSLEQLLAR